MIRHLLPVVTMVSKPHPVISIPATFELSVLLKVATLRCDVAAPVVYQTIRAAIHEVRSNLSPLAEGVQEMELRAVDYVCSNRRACFSVVNGTCDLDGHDQRRLSSSRWARIVMTHDFDPWAFRLDSFYVILIGPIRSGLGGPSLQARFLSYTLTSDTWCCRYCGQCLRQKKRAASLRYILRYIVDLGPMTFGKAFTVLTSLVKSLNVVIGLKSFTIGCISL